MRIGIWSESWDWKVSNNWNGQARTIIQYSSLGSVVCGAAELSVLMCSDKYVGYVVLSQAASTDPNFCVHLFTSAEYLPLL